MIFKSKFKPELCLGKDPARPQLEHCYLDTANGAQRLVATDGIRMIVVRVAPEPGDTAGRVTTDALQSARTVAKKTRNEQATIALNGTQKTDAAEFVRPDDKKFPFPPVDAVLVDAPTKGQADTLTIGLNAQLLHEIAKALGAKNGEIEITLRPGADRVPLRITDPYEPDAFAVLMPMRVKPVKP